MIFFFLFLVFVRKNHSKLWIFHCFFGLFFCFNVVDQVIMKANIRSVEDAEIPLLLSVR